MFSKVAPYVGAWIETVDHQARPPPFVVAPYVGAWIETNDQFQHEKSLSVAPYVGAWIETLLGARGVPAILSHPTWVRGLKQTRCEGPAPSVCRTLRGCVD